MTGGAALRKDQLPQAMLDPVDVATSGMLMVDGMLGASPGSTFDNVLEAYGESRISLVSELSEYSPLSLLLWNAVKHTEPACIWGYDVDGEFGKWFAEVILEQKATPDRRIAVDCLGRLVKNETGLSVEIDEIVGQFLAGVSREKNIERQSATIGHDGHTRLVEAVRELLAAIEQGDPNTVADHYLFAKREIDALPMAVSNKPALQWFDIETHKNADRLLPPEQKNIVVILDSNIPTMGRNIWGRFAEYDSMNDRFVEWMEGHDDGFHGIKRWAEIVAPVKQENVLDSVSWEGGRESTSLAEGKELATLALHRAGLPVPEWRPSVGSLSPWEYLDIDVGGYKPLSVGASAGGVVSIDGDPFTPGDRKVNVFLDRVELSLAAGISKRSELVLEAPVEVGGYVLAFPGASDAEANELLETLKGGGNAVFRVDGPLACEVLRSAVEQAGLEPRDFQP